LSLVKTSGHEVHTWVNEGLPVVTRRPVNEGINEGVKKGVNEGVNEGVHEGSMRWSMRGLRLYTCARLG
jgi:hypothetical protein